MSLNIYYEKFDQQKENFMRVRARVCETLSLWESLFNRSSTHKYDCRTSSQAVAAFQSQTPSVHETGTLLFP